MLADVSRHSENTSQPFIAVNENRLTNQNIDQDEHEYVLLPVVLYSRVLSGTALVSFGTST